MSQQVARIDNLLEGRPRESWDESRRDERDSFLTLVGCAVRNGTLTTYEAMATFGFVEGISRGADYCAMA